MTILRATGKEAINEALDYLTSLKKPLRTFTKEQKERAQKRLDEIETLTGCGYAVERGELRTVINS